MAHLARRPYRPPDSPRRRSLCGLQRWSDRRCARSDHRHRDFGACARLRYRHPVIHRQPRHGAVAHSGRIAHGYLGIGLQPVALPEPLSRKLGLDRRGGLIVLSLAPQGPAEQAGLLVGDILIELAGRPLHDVDDLQAALGGDRIGERIRVGWCAAANESSQRSRSANGPSGTVEPMSAELLRVAVVSTSLARRDRIASMLRDMRGIQNTGAVATIGELGRLTPIPDAVVVEAPADIAVDALLESSPPLPIVILSR